MFLKKHKVDPPEELSDLTTLLEYLGISSKEFNYFSKHSRRLYTTSLITKRTGGFRVLERPTDRLKYIQRKILRKLEEMYVPRVSVHGFIKGRGIMSNAAAHQKRPFLLNIDLADYFGSVGYNRVVGVIRSFGVSSEVSRAIASLTVVKNKLPQGAPTSPILANMVSFHLDISLHRFAKKHNLRYTRFADDISLSSFIQPLSLFKDSKVQIGKLSEEDLSEKLVQIVLSSGFNLNPKKLWFSDRKLRKQVTGLVVNEFPNVPRKFVRNIRSVLYKISKHGIVYVQAEYSTKYHTSKSIKKVLRGKIEWVGQIKGRSDPVFRSLADRYNQEFPSNHIIIEPTYDEILDKAVWIVEWISDCTVGGEDDVKGAQGTAFFLDGVGLITADHVLEELPEGMHADIYLSGKPTEKFKAWITNKACKVIDVALLTHNIPDDKFLSLPQSTGGFRKRDEITAYGFPSYHLGDQISEIQGRITAVSTIHAVERIRISEVLNQGISGGPVLDKRSHVIGIVHKGGLHHPRQLVTSVHEVLKVCSSEN